MNMRSKSANKNIQRISASLTADIYIMPMEASMKIVQIEQDVLDEMFVDLRQALELKKYTAKDFVNPSNPIEEMANDLHRHFNYHICRFKDALERA